MARRRPEELWLGLVLIGTAFELWALRKQRQEATLSAFTRKAFRTDTPIGQAAFVLSYAAASLWLVPHIAKGKNHVGR